MLSSISTFHSRKISTYKRLLERTQLSSAAQLHALQAEVQILKQQLDSQQDGQNNGNANLAGGNLLLGTFNGLCVKCGGKRGGYWSGFRGFDEEDDDEDGDLDVASALRGKGKGKYDFDEKEVRKVVRGLPREARGRL